MCLEKVNNPANKDVTSPFFQQTQRLRALLALIDRDQDAETDYEMLKAIGVTKDNIHALLAHGFVTYSTSGMPDIPTQEQGSEGCIAIPVASNVSEQKMSSAYAYADSADITSFADSSFSSHISVGHSREDVQKLMALYALFNNLIRPTFGLRGVMLQLQLERCAMLDDYRDVAVDILKGIRKAKGEAAAVELQLRIDSILGLIAQ